MASTSLTGGTAAPRGLLVDYGGVLTTSIPEAFRAFERSEGLEHTAVIRLLSADDRAREILVALEVGAGSEEAFEAGIGELLGVPGAGLIGRLLAEVRQERAMLDAVRSARSAGIRTGLVSNSWGVGGYPAEVFDGMFDVVLLSGEVGLRKPDPEIYRRAAGALGLEPGECVFVDDMERNLEPATLLGMAVVHHTDPAPTIAKLSRLLGLDLASRPL
jgi:epoxide hydrolase-like predicted phosphatase